MDNGNVNTNGNTADNHVNDEKNNLDNQKILNKNLKLADNNKLKQHKLNI